MLHALLYAPRRHARRHPEQSQQTITPSGAGQRCSGPGQSPAVHDAIALNQELAAARLELKAYQQAAASEAQLRMAAEDRESEQAATISALRAALEEQNQNQNQPQPQPQPQQEAERASWRAAEAEAALRGERAESARAAAKADQAEHGREALPLEHGTIAHFEQGLETLAGTPPPMIYQAMCREHGFLPSTDPAVAASAAIEGRGSYRRPAGLEEGGGEEYVETMPRSLEYGAGGAAPAAEGDTHHANLIFEPASYGRIPTSAKYEWLCVEGRAGEAQAWLARAAHPRTRELCRRKLRRLRELAQELEARGDLEEERARNLARARPSSPELVPASPCRRHGMRGPWCRRRKT